VLGGDYEVSSRGRVRRARPGRCTYVGRVMRPTLMKIGYYRVGVTIGGRNVPSYVHRLVAQAFLGPCPDGYEVNHIDGRKTNNRPANLEYVTHGGNMRHARRIGLTPVGERVASAILTPAAVRGVRSLRALGRAWAEIAKRYGVHPRTVRDVGNGKTWRHVR
jgi:hypothetical protein